MNNTVVYLVTKEGEKKEEGMGDKKTEDGKSDEANDKKTEDKEDEVKVVNSGEELEEDEAKKIVESFTKDSGSCEYELHNVVVNSTERLVYYLHAFTAKHLLENNLLRGAGQLKLLFYAEYMFSGRF